MYFTTHTKNANWKEKRKTVPGLEEVFSSTPRFKSLGNLFPFCQIFKSQKTIGFLSRVLLIFPNQFFRNSVQFSSVAQSCLTLHDPMNRSMPGLPVNSSTFYKISGLFIHSTLWRRQFEGPQEVVCSFEIICKSLDLLNQILHADDAIFAKRKSKQ